MDTCFTKPKSFLGEFMKKLKLIFNANGATLMESIISILIFTVLIAAVIMMISLSLRISNNSFQSASEMQTSANQILMGEGDAKSSEIIINFKRIIYGGAGEEIISSINIPIDVFISDEYNFFAFEPSR